MKIIKIGQQSRAFKQGQSSKQEKRVADKAFRKLIVWAVIVVVVTDMTTGLVHGYSDRERDLQAKLSVLEGSAYQLTLTDRDATTLPAYVSLKQAQQDAVRDQLTQCRRFGRRFHYRDAHLDRIENLLDLYCTAQAGQISILRSGTAAENLRYVHQRLDPPSRDLLRDIDKATYDVNMAAFGTSLVSHEGSILVLLATFVFAANLFRRVGEAQNTSIRLAAEAEVVSRSERRFQSLVYNSSDVIAIVDACGKFIYLSSAVERLWQYSPSELEETSFVALIHQDDIPMLTNLLDQVSSRSSLSEKCEVRLRYRDGSYCSSEVVMTNLTDDPGVEGIVLTCRDVTERKAFESQLAHQAFHDPLTGLANRSLFVERLQHALERTLRSTQPVGLVFVDLDNFKVVNDSLGHEAGDILLKAVAERLQSCVRLGDTVARLGGDEFTILLENLTDEREVHAVIERITQVMQSPVDLAGKQVVTTGSIGIAISHGNYTLPDALLRDADTAMYRAKSGNKASSVVFDQTMNTRTMERLQLEIEMRQGIEVGEFRVHYQPILDLATGKVVELEALARWQHPSRGLIPPADFIPLAEETGLIVPLGKWVLQEACKQAKQWQTDFPNDKGLCVGVNVSARQLEEDDIVETVAQALSEAGLEASCLNLEITESVMMQNRDQVIPKLYELKKLGVCLALDDFGTGYSSISYLSTLPLDIIKIDRSFVLRLGQNREDEAIVRAIVQLARTLNLQITSEGIETQQQLTELRALGCDTGQGYLFAKPIPGPDVSVYLQDVDEVELPKAA